MTHYVSCIDFANAGISWECCGSCHSEADLGGTLMIRIPNGQLWLQPKTEAQVCCLAPQFSRQDFAKALLAWRAREKEMRRKLRA